MLTKTDKIWIRPSSIKTFLKNPYEWYQTHILKIYTPPRSYLSLGSAVHHGINVGYEDYIKTGVLPKLEYLLEATKEEYETLAKETHYIDTEDKTEIGYLATRLVEQYHKTIMPTVNPLHTEHYVEVAFDNNPYIAGVRGTIDLITQELELVDVKTASSLSNNLQIKHELQLSIYTLLAKKSDMQISGAKIHEIIKPTSTMDVRARIVDIQLQEKKADEILELLASRIADFFRAVNGEPILDPANLFHIDNKEYMYA